MPDTPDQVGQQVRILPHHACATAAQFGAFPVVDDSGGVKATWQRFNSW